MTQTELAVALLGWMNRSCKSVSSSFPAAPQDDFHLPRKAETLNASIWSISPDNWANCMYPNLLVSIMSAALTFYLRAERGTGRPARTLLCVHEELNIVASMGSGGNKCEPTGPGLSRPRVVTRRRFFRGEFFMICSSWTSFPHTSCRIVAESAKRIMVFGGIFAFVCMVNVNIT